MTLENTEGGLSLEQEIASLGTDNTPEPEPQPDPPPATPSPAPAPEAPPEEPDELTILRRTIAMDPALREIYAAEKYGLPLPQQVAAPPLPPPPAPPPQMQQPQPGDLTSIFGEDGYDPYNLEHQMALVSLAVQQSMAPALTYVQQLQQQEQQETALQKQQAMVERLKTAETSVVEILDRELPGFKDLAGKEGLGYREKAAIREAEDIFAAKMAEEFPQRQDGRHVEYWFNKRVQEDVLRKCLPSIKSVFTELGVALGQKAGPAVNRQAAKELYVESSNAVPTATGGAFQKAYESDDVFGMIRALR